jgi:rsbT co-antagonist protein RsbR
MLLPFYLIAGETIAEPWSKRIVIESPRAEKNDRHSPGRLDLGGDGIAVSPEVRRKLVASQWSKTVALFAEHKTKIMAAWLEGQATDFRIRKKIASGDDLRRQSQQFMDALVPAMLADKLGDPSAAEYAPVRSFLAEVAHQRQQQGFTPFEIAAAIISFKDHVFPFLETGYRSQPDLLVQEFISICKLVDTLAMKMFESMIRKSEEQIKKQAQEILELSTPVMQVWEGIVAAPLIGSLDSQRTQQFMERLLHRIVETNSPVALVDITGVPTIDTQTAQHLIETISAVRLLGAQVVLTGVRPAIAQTLVHLGIDLSGIVTRSSLSAGLRVALEILQLRVASKNDHH